MEQFCILRLGDTYHRVNEGHSFCALQNAEAADTDPGRVFQGAGSAWTLLSDEDAVLILMEY